MRIILKTISICWLLYMTFFLLGLYRIPDIGKNKLIPETTLDSIFENPKKYVGKTLRFSGEICCSSYFLGFGFYKVFNPETKTGIWVLSDELPFPDGSFITVTGIVKPVIKAFNSDGMVLREKTSVRNKKPLTTPEEPVSVTIKNHY